MQKIQLAEGLSFSRIVSGQMRIPAWGMDSAALLKYMEELMDLGIDTFDNADIYGNYTCEKLVGDALALSPSVRNKMTIITKCGIKIKSDKFPERKIQHYDYRYEYIMQEVENSLRNFRTDHIDVLLLHRPSDLLNPEEVAKAFDKLKKDGKVRYFGVSNFLKEQFSMLQSYTDEKLVTNQIEISPYCIEHLENMNLDFLQERRVHPMAYCPMAGGRFEQPTNAKAERASKTLHEIAEELNADSIDKVIYAWLFKHPAGIIPINGSGKIERIKSAIAALDIDMSIEQWARILVAARGVVLP